MGRDIRCQLLTGREVLFARVLYRATHLSDDKYRRILCLGYTKNYSSKKLWLEKKPLKKIIPL